MAPDPMREVREMEERRMDRKVVVSLTCAGLLALMPLSTAVAIESAGVMAFDDACYDRIVAMTPDGRARVTLPFIGDHERMLDISRRGSVVSVLGLGRVVPSDPQSGSAMYVLDASARHDPVRLATPTGSSFAAFSPGASRVAWVNDYQDGSLAHHDDLWMADLTLDANDLPTILKNPRWLADLLAFGQRSDSSATGALTGALDFAPDGSSLAVTIYDDIWVLPLASDGQSLDRAQARDITRTPNEIEWWPAWAPASSLAGNKIAFTGGRISQILPGFWAVSSRDLNVSTIDVDSGIMNRVTTKSNTANAGPEHPDWSPTGSWLLFDAQASSGKRGAPCGNFVNFDLFQIPWDGSGRAVDVTNTAGTSVELNAGWGW
jgi:dipeptidyl aminopeptidase/acylaminoacyl peptidase